MAAAVYPGRQKTLRRIRHRRARLSRSIGYVLAALMLLGAMTSAPAASAEDRIYAKTAAGGALANAQRPPARAMWVWETDKLLGDPAARAAFIRFCRAHRIGLVFLQALYQVRALRGGEIRCRLSRTGALGELLGEAARAGIAVDALEGRPEFALASGHPRVLALVRAVIEFNRQAPPARRFHGIHLDNEPYLLLGFDGPQRAAILRQFLELNEKVMALLGRAPDRLSYGVDLPFWFDDPAQELSFHGVRQSVARHVLDLVDNVAIMDYRTAAGGPDGIIRHARDQIEYADRAGKNVYIGVETSRAQPARTHFLYGITEATWQSLGRADAPFLMLSRLDDFRLASFDDGNRRYVGLVEPQSLPDRAAFDAALARLYAIYGASGAGRQADLPAISEAAYAALTRRREYAGFAPFTLAGAGGRLRAAGFVTTELMLPKITFAGRSKRELEEALRETALAFPRDPALAGFAVHDYRGWRELPD